MKTLGKLSCAVALASCLAVAGCSNGAADVKQNPPKEGSGTGGAATGEQKEGASLSQPSGDYALVSLRLPNMS